MEEIVYHTNFQLENTYWWFIARNRIVMELLNKFVKIDPASQVLDVGCGTGGFTKKLLEQYDTIGLDTSPLAIEYCKQREIEKLFLGPLNEFPTENYRIQAITILDVIEHIESDEAIVQQLYDTLPHNGWLVATVPAYKWLWSEHDVLHKHYRRYTKKEFVTLLRKHNFEIEFASYFNSLLFGLSAVNRIFGNLFHKKNEPVAPVDPVPPFLDKIFKSVFQSEKNLLPHIKFPFGLSILVIAKKV